MGRGRLAGCGPFFARSALRACAAPQSRKQRKRTGDTVAQQTANARKHTLQIETRTRLVAAGVERVDFFSDELITAQTSDGRMHIKGEGLYIENLNAETGELLVKGRVIALSYDDGVKPASVLGRIFK